MKNKKMFLDLNKETVQILEKNELEAVQGGTTTLCVTAGIVTVYGAGVAGSWWNCELPDDGGITAESKGSEVELYGGCLLCAATQ